MATAPSSLIIFFLFQVWVLKFSRELMKERMPDRQTRTRVCTHMPVPPTCCQPHPTPRSAQHMPRPAWLALGFRRAPTCLDGPPQGSPIRRAALTWGAAKTTSAGTPQSVCWKGGGEGPVHAASGWASCPLLAGCLLRDDRQRPHRALQRPHVWWGWGSTSRLRLGNAPAGPSTAPSAQQVCSRARTHENRHQGHTVTTPPVCSGAARAGRAQELTCPPTNTHGPSTQRGGAQPPRERSPDRRYGVAPAGGRDVQRPRAKSHMAWDPISRKHPEEADPGTQRDQGRQGPGQGLESLLGDENVPELTVRAVQLCGL